MPTIKEQIFEFAKKRRAKVGIGILKPSDSITDSLKRASEYVDIAVVGAAIEGFENIPATQETIEEVECEKILSGELEAIIRGQADMFKFEDVLAKKGNYDRRVFLGYGVIEDAYGRSFFDTSGSHSDGWTKNSKRQMVDELIKEVELLRLKPKIGFLTSVRPGSVGRNFFFDQSWEQAEDLVRYYANKSYEAKNYNIEVETAVADEANIIVFSNGMSGNIFNRALGFLAKNIFIVYSSMGMKENVVQNNRTLQDYYNHLMYAAAKVNSKR